jgi:23S rRNA (pseudouridine1915-N3)-methyltransferase
MKIQLILVGKTSESFLKEGTDIYLRRLTNYISLSVDVVATSSLSDKSKAMEEERKAIAAKLLPGDYLVILDETGIENSSRQLAALLQKWMLQSIQRVVFITGGPFGISPELRMKANYILSLSKLTFTHQMVRLILAEQIYRAMTIIRNENYHHD